MICVARDPVDGADQFVTSQGRDFHSATFDPLVEGERGADRVGKVGKFREHRPGGEQTSPVALEEGAAFLMVFVTFVGKRDEWPGVDE